MADKWFDDHEGWMSQFNEIVNDALNVDPESDLDELDEMAMSDIAAKLANGKIGLLEAIHRTLEWVAGRQGFKKFHDQESFELECQMNNLLDITDEWRLLMLRCGEPGIADAVIRIFADPRILVIGPGDIADLENPPSVGIHGKAWFELAHLNPTEQKNFQWAVETATKMKLEAG